MVVIVSSELAEKLAKIGFEVVLRNSQLVVKLGRDRQVEGFYNIAIVIKDSDAERLSESLAKVLRESLVVEVAACVFCKSTKIVREGDKYVCENYHTMPREALDSVKIAFVQVDATGRKEDREIAKILQYGATGDKAEIKTCGEVVLNELAKLVHDHLAPVLADVLKLVVSELSLAIGSIEYHVKRLEKSIEREEVRGNIGVAIDTTKLQTLTDLGISREIALAQLQLHTFNKISERQSRSAILASKAIVEKFRYVKAFYIGDSQSRKGLLGIYCFDGLRWVNCETEIFNFLSELYKKAELDLAGISYSKLRSDVEKFIADNLKDYLRYEPLKIAFKNCVWSWETERCGDPNPEDYVYHLIPWSINTGLMESILRELRSKVVLDQKDYEGIVFKYADRYTPKTLTAFRQWAGSKWILLYELMGAVLYPSPIKKAVLLTDAEGKDGDTGKSTYIKYLQLVLGPENYSGVPLQVLVSEEFRFQRAAIYRKLANFYADLPERAVKDVGAFKVLTGEDTIVIERKFRDPIVWRPYTKHIFSANTPPHVENADVAFWKRWLVIEFVGEFKEKVKDFEKTLADEIPNALAIALACFTVVMRRRFTFSYENTAEDAKNKWLSKSDTVYAFLSWAIENQTLRKADGIITKVSNIYETYVSWCKAYGEDPIAQNRFTMRLKQLGYEVINRGGKSYLKSYALDKERAKELLEKEVEETTAEETEQRTIQEYLS
jgi:P4 family phage/plasmid primase-like protien